MVVQSCSTFYFSAFRVSARERGSLVVPCPHSLLPQFLDTRQRQHRVAMCVAASPNVCHRVSADACDAADAIGPMNLILGVIGGAGALRCIAHAYEQLSAGSFRKKKKKTKKN